MFNKPQITPKNSIMEESQTIYINIDDSGKISNKEEVAVYGGIVFLNKQEKDKFITQYRSIVNEIKCKYCSLNSNFCQQESCPELKHSNLKNQDKRRLMNYIKKYMVFACVIHNENLYEYIVSSKASKGRYNDYALRRLIKGILNNLIITNQMNPNKSVKIILNIDEQSTKSNGYYSLKDGLFEELKYGIVNFNYSKRHSPILNNNLEIRLTYLKSDKSYVVQAADLIAGTIRAKNIQNQNDNTSLMKSLTFVDYLLFLP